MKRRRKAVSTRPRWLPKAAAKKVVHAEALTEAVLRPSGWTKNGKRLFDPSGCISMPVARIKIGKRHRKDFGNLAALAADINERGLLHPIVIDADDRLIAGERRWRAWQLSQFRALPIPVTVVPLADLAAGEWAENNPALRKDFLPTEAVAIKQEIEARLKPAAATRVRAGRASAAKSARDEASKSGAQAAAFTGKSRRTVEKAEAIVEAARAEPEKYRRLVEAMDRSGRVDAPYKRLQVMKAAETIRAEPPPLPGNGPYRGVVIDFPWAAEPDGDDPDRLARGYYPYPTMSQAEIVAYARERISPILHDDCVVALWITNYHLALGHQVQIFKALDLRPVTILTGRKDAIGRGQVARGSTEHVVIARRGNAVIEPFPRTDFDFAVDRNNHSRKPQAFYDLFAAAVAAPRYASLFETADRGPLWDGHGDKIEARKAAESAPRAALSSPEDPGDEYWLLENIASGFAIDFAAPALLERVAMHGFVAGKKKPKLTKRGRLRLEDLQAARAHDHVMAALPDDLRGLIAVYRDALFQLNEGVVTRDLELIAAADAVIKRAQIKANGGDNFGIAADDSPAEQLRRDAAAPIGTVPLWRQRGMFVLDIDGVPYLVQHDEGSSLAVHAMAKDKPFCSETGYRSLDFDLSLSALDAPSPGEAEFLGETVAQCAGRLIREAIANEDGTGDRKPRRNPLPLPEKVYALPASWDAVYARIDDNCGDPPEVEQEAAE